MFNTFRGIRFCGTKAPLACAKIPTELNMEVYHKQANAQRRHTQIINFATLGSTIGIIIMAVGVRHYVALIVLQRFGEMK